MEQEQGVPKANTFRTPSFFYNKDFYDNNSCYWHPRPFRYPVVSDRVQAVQHVAAIGYRIAMLKHSFVTIKMKTPAAFRFSRLGNVPQII
jgi:hypothetical protein